jgi:hypothetical protein
MGKIEEAISRVKERQRNEDTVQETAYFKEKARLIKQEQIKAGKEEARQSFTKSKEPAPKGLYEKASEFIKDRGAAINRGISGAPRQNYRAGLPSFPSDPFGVGRMGNPFEGPRQPAAPRGKKKKRSTAPAPRQRSNGGIDMMGIPKHNMMGIPKHNMMGIPNHMRWMF